MQSQPGFDPAVAHRLASWLRSHAGSRMLIEVGTFDVQLNRNVPILSIVTVIDLLDGSPPDGPLVVVLPQLDRARIRIEPAAVMHVELDGGSLRLYNDDATFVSILDPAHRTEPTALPAVL